MNKENDKRDILHALYATHEDLAKKVQFNTKMIYELQNGIEHVLHDALSRMEEHFEEMVRKMKE